MVLQAPSNLISNTSVVGRSHLQTACPVLHPPIGKRVLLMSNLILPFFSSKWLPLVVAGSSACRVSTRSLELCPTQSPLLPGSPALFAMLDVFNSKMCQIFRCPCRATQQGRQRAHRRGYQCCEQVSLLRGRTWSASSDLLQAAGAG